MGSSTEVCQLLPQNVHLASVHKLDDVVHRVSLQLQPKVLQPGSRDISIVIDNNIPVPHF